MKPKEYLERRGETPNAFSKRSGIPQPTVWRHINEKVGYITPRIMNLWFEYSDGAVTFEDLMPLTTTETAQTCESA